MLYHVTWRCLSCGHTRHVDHKVPKINPPREPDWRALEQRARCSACRVRGQCAISVSAHRAK